VLASASTLEADVRKDIANGGNTAAAAVVGKRIAEKAKAIGVETVAFDRSGFRFHGRVKALAEAAREAASSSEDSMAEQRRSSRQPQQQEDRGDGLREKMISINRVTKVVRAVASSASRR